MNKSVEIEKEFSVIILAAGKSERLGFPSASAERIGAEPVRSRRAFHAEPDQQQDGADNREDDVKPPSGAVEVVKPADGDGKAR